MYLLIIANVEFYFFISSKEILYITMRSFWFLFHFFNKYQQLPLEMPEMFKQRILFISFGPRKESPFVPLSSCQTRWSSNKKRDYPLRQANHGYHMTVQTYGHA